MRYEFKSLKGGNVGSYPLSFNFKNLRTPNDTRVPLTLQVLDQEGNIFANKKIVVHFEAEAKSEYAGAKYVVGYHGETKRFERVVKTYDEATPKEDTTPADPAATRTVFRHILTAVPQPNSIAGQGEYADGEYTLEEHLPEGAVLLENDSANTGWTVKEGENGVYIKNLRLNELTAHNNRFTIPIAVGFPNLPYSQQDGTTIVPSSKLTAQCSTRKNGGYHLSSGHRICVGIVSVGEAVHCESVIVSQIYSGVSFGGCVIGL